MSRRLRRLGSAAIALLVLLTLAVPPSLAHEEREVAGYTFEVGLIGEPVFTGDQSGLEFSVIQGEAPVAGLESTLQAEVIYQDRRMALRISPRFEAEGWYESVFFPTAAGAYTFRIFGDINGTAVDESFTSGDVRDAQSGQFPVQFPPTAELVADAQRGADAAARLPMAMTLGAAGVVAGLAALGLSLAARRRSP